MSLYRGMPSAEFIDYLRSWAINGNAQEVVIELIDDLRGNEDVADELDAMTTYRDELQEKAEALSLEFKKLHTIVSELFDVYTDDGLRATLKELRERAEELKHAVRDSGECIEDNFVEEI